MTRLEAGGLSLKREWQPLQEVGGAALHHLDRRLRGRGVKGNLPADLPLVNIVGVAGEQVLALRDVSLQVARGAFIALMGRSGSGKTTLLNMIGGLDRPTSGRIALFDQPLSGLSQERLTVLRRELGVLSVRETCGIGVCGACTALVDGEPLSACLLLAPLVEGAAVTTAEGLGGDELEGRRGAREASGPFRRSLQTAHPRRTERIVAVTKGHPLEAATAAVRAGLGILGENRIGELEEKVSALGRDAAEWHMIGHLQRNKARRAIPLFDRIHSVDSLRLARVLSKEALRAGRVVRGYLQVNVSGEETKGGFGAEEAVEALGTIRGLEGVVIDGLMTMAPLTDDDAVLRYVAGSGEANSVSVHRGGGAIRRHSNG